MNAKRYLQQVGKLNKLIANKIIEKEQWQGIAYGTGTFSDGERVQSSGSQQKMENAVCRYADLEREIDECIDRYVDLRDEVIRTIEQLPAVEYDILHIIYIQEKELDDVANIYGKSYSWASSTHGRAVKMVQDILNKREIENEQINE